MKKFFAVAIALMMVLSLGVFAADISVDVAALPGAVDFGDAQYTTNVIKVESSSGISIGSYDLSKVSKIVVYSGSDPGAPIDAHKIYVCKADGSVIGEAQLAQIGAFWAQGQRPVEIAIDTDYNGDVLLKKDEPGHGIAVDQITLVEKTADAETEAVTEAATEAATDAVTDAATDVVTDAATDAATNAATDAATNADSSANGDKNDKDGGFPVVPVVIVAVVVVAAVAAVVVMKKKK